MRSICLRLGLTVAVTLGALGWRVPPVPAAPALAPAGGGGEATWQEDPYLEDQWGLQMIDAPKAWAVAKGKGVLIAIVDTGIDLDHPDLASKISRKGKDLTGGGAPEDQAGHGTAVAGIAAAATGNGIGVGGVAPAARILPLRVCPSNCEPSAVNEAIRFAADAGAEVINLSLGIHPVLAPLIAEEFHDEAIEYAWSKGSVVVAAAGNNTMPLCSHPANAENVICVGGVARDGTRSPTSDGDATGELNFVVAPGGRPAPGLCSEMILSTVIDPDDEAVDPCKVAPGYEYTSGTSMAAPFVSGIAALLSSQGLTNEEIVERILSSSSDLGAPGWDPVYGYGLVDAFAAVSG